jgi:hypothetical protein
MAQRRVTKTASYFPQQSDKSDGCFPNYKRPVALAPTRMIARPSYESMVLTKYTHKKLWERLVTESVW